VAEGTRQTSGGARDRAPMLAARRRVHDWEEARHATWLELFFDLVVVVAVARLAALLHDDHSLGGIAIFVGLLVIVWWVWISFSYFADLFDSDQDLDRLAQLTAMLGAGVLAFILSGGVAEDSAALAVTNAVLFAFLALLYLHAGREEPRARELCRWYVLGSATGSALWAASLLVATPGRYVVWGVAVAANALISGPIAYARTHDPPTQVSHMPERFGLFVIVVLGESILATVNGASAISLEAGGVLIAVAGFAVAASLWWVYFDQFDEQAIDRAIAGGRRAQVRSFIYGYGHLLIYASVVAIGVGVELALEEAAHENHPVPLFGIGVAAALTGLLVISAGIGRRGAPILLAARLGIAALAVATAALALEPLPAVVAVAVALVGLVVLERSSAAGSDPRRI
jgi:low temperature requirement protein LtrA